MTDPKTLTFALPGDITTLTGGYIYDCRMVQGLRDQGRHVDVLALPDSFPTPSDSDVRQALDALQALPADRPVIIDGLAFGALDPQGVAAIRAPIVAMIHHPLAQESALPADLADHLWRTERANLAHARHVMVPSPHTRDMLIDRYDVPADRITVARPGTDRPEQPATPQDPPLILSVGILHPRKGHDVLIAALAALVDLDWQAVIVGNPGTRPMWPTCRRRSPPADWVDGWSWPGGSRRIAWRTCTERPRSLRWRPGTRVTASSLTRRCPMACPSSARARARCRERFRQMRACWSHPTMRPRWRRRGAAC